MQYKQLALDMIQASSDNALDRQTDRQTDARAEDRESSEGIKTGSGYEPKILRRTIDCHL